MGVCYVLLFWASSYRGDSLSINPHAVVLAGRALLSLNDSIVSSHRKVKMCFVLIAISAVASRSLASPRMSCPLFGLDFWTPLVSKIWGILTEPFMVVLLHWQMYCGLNFFCRESCLAATRGLVDSCEWTWLWWAVPAEQLFGGRLPSHQPLMRLQKETTSLCGGLLRRGTCFKSETLRGDTALTVVHKPNNMPPVWWKTFNCHIWLCEHFIVWHT